MSTERDLVTAIQEKLDNSTLTVRRNGRLLGRVLKWGKGDWRIQPAEPQRFATLEEAVNALAADADEYEMGDADRRGHSRGGSYGT